MHNRSREGEVKRLVSSAKRKKRIHLSRLWAHITRTSHLPARGQHCTACGSELHTLCWDTDLAPADVSPMFALHDADLAVNGEAA